MANTEPLTRSGKGHPCPVCNRTKDADCAFNDTIVCCHNNVGHQAGKYEQNGWVYRKDTSDGRCGVFSRRRPRRPREPAEVYDYSDTQRTARFVYPDGSKKVLPQHWDGSKWITKAGPKEWGAYREEQVTGQGEIYEFEGEKCADMGASDGLAAISHPGFAHKVQQIVQRYRRLKAAGAELIVVIADNDETGPKRAAQSADAAYKVGLTCLVLNAQDIWDNMPKGGSIDDAPGQGAERIAPLLAMVEKLQAAGPLDTNDIERIQLQTYAYATRPIFRVDPNPPSREVAGLSIRISTAVALKQGSAWRQDFAAWDDPEVRRLRNLIDVEVDDEIEARYPDLNGCRLRITLADGTAREAYIPNMKGEPEFRMTDGEMRRKFSVLSGDLVPQDQADRLYAICNNLESLEFVGELLQLCCTAEPIAV